MSGGFLTYALVFLSGALLGLAELVSRHPDYPVRAAFSIPGCFYLLLNGGLSVLALLIVTIQPPDWLLTPMVEGKPRELNLLVTVLVVGFGAAAFFRSSFFKLKTPDGEIAVGPSLVIDIFLKASDDAVDRMLGERRLSEVSEIMAGVSFTKAMTVLPTQCFAALRRVTAETQSQVALQTKALASTPSDQMDDQTKAVSLGLDLMSRTGRPILKKAVDLLGDKIKA